VALFSSWGHGRASDGTTLHASYTDHTATDVFTLSLHDALPIFHDRHRRRIGGEKARAREQPIEPREELPLRSLVLGDRLDRGVRDRKSTRLNSSHDQISYAVLCSKKERLRSGARLHDAGEGEQQ